MGDWNNNQHFANLQNEYERYGIDPENENANIQLMEAQMRGNEVNNWENEQNMANYNRREAQQERLRARRYRNQTTGALMNARANLPENVARRITGLLNVPYSRPVNVHPELKEGFAENLFTNNANNAPPGLVNIGLFANPYGNMPALEPNQEEVNGLNGGKRKRRSRRRVTRRRKASKRRAHRSRRRT